MEACLSNCTSRLGMASYSCPPRPDVVDLTFALTFVTQGPASCQQGFILRRVDSGLSLPAPPYWQASVLSVLSLGTPSTRPSLLYCPLRGYLLQKGTSLVLRLYPAAEQRSWSLKL